MPMSQSFHQGIHNFSNGYERSPTMKQGGDWISQRDIFQVQGLELQQQHPVQVEVNSEEPQVYDTGGNGMLTEMIDFPRGRKTANHDILLDGQIQSSYRWSQKQQLPLAAVNEAGLPLMNHPYVIASSSSYYSSSLQMSVPYSSGSHHDHLRGYQFVDSATMASEETSAHQFYWICSSSNVKEGDDGTRIGRTLEGQGLSLSLCSSLPNLEAAKFQEFRTRDGGMYFFDEGVGPSMNFCRYKNQEPIQHITDYTSQVHVGLPAASRTGNVLRNLRYLRAAQELLEEFCCVGRGLFKNPMVVKGQSGNPRSISILGGPVNSSARSKDRRPLSAAEKTEHQRKKVKLLSMLDEVDARYTHYCEQMQAIVNSFDSVIGFGAAAPYTNLAQKAMSLHFRSIKDAILAQVKVSCELLGDQDVTGTIGLTKGETPRLRFLEQKFRQQKGLHQLGMLDPDTWRPQRGLPERSVNILRAWLFEHFLHPYPSDADKNLLSRQAGLSKNQISNWFINARVRLWKPMVEDIYNEEAKEEEQDETAVNIDHSAAYNEAKSDSVVDHQDHQNQNQIKNQNIVSARTPMHNKTTITATLVEGMRRSQINATEKDPSKNIINYRQYTLGNQAILQGTPTTTSTSISNSGCDHDQTLPTYGCFTTAGTPQAAVGMHGSMTSSLVRMGTQAPGDVSLTLGLHHSANVPRKTTEFSVRDLGAF